jgi:hypothetical protein
MKMQQKNFKETLLWVVVASRKSIKMIRLEKSQNMMKIIKNNAPKFFTKLFTQIVA